MGTDYKWSEGTEHFLKLDSDDKSLIYIIYFNIILNILKIINHVFQKGEFYGMRVSFQESCYLLKDPFEITSSFYIVHH